MLFFNFKIHGRVIKWIDVFRKGFSTKVLGSRPLLTGTLRGNTATKFWLVRWNGQNPKQFLCCFSSQSGNDKWRNDLGFRCCNRLFVFFSLLLLLLLQFKSKHLQVSISFILHKLLHYIWLCQLIDHQAYQFGNFSILLLSSRVVDCWLKMKPISLNLFDEMPNEYSMINDVITSLIFYFLHSFRRWKFAAHSGWLSCKYNL